MSDTVQPRQPRDRHSDHLNAPQYEAASSGATSESPRSRRIKPPVLRRSTIRWIALVWIGLVLWGTVGPLGTDTKPWIVPVPEYRWIPPIVPLSSASYNDIFTNVLVYLPLGVALGLLLRRRGGIWAVEASMAMVLAVTLSYSTEFAQQFMPARTFDRVDLFVNSGAALFGCLLAPLAQRLLRRGHEILFVNRRQKPWLTSAWIMTAIVFVLMTMPWDFHKPSLEVDYLRGLDLLDLRRFGAFLVLGFLIAMAMIERLGRGPAAFGESIKRIFVCGVFFEAAQIFIRSHACGFLDISTAFFGGLAGIGAARWLTGTTLTKGVLPTQTKRMLATIVLFALIGGQLAFGVAAAFGHGSGSNGVARVLLPFQIDFMQSFDRVMIHILESLFVYATVTMLCLYLSLGTGRVLSALVLFGMVGIVEVFRGFLGQHGFDLTPFLTAVAAWVIIQRCWKAFVPQVWHPAQE